MISYTSIAISFMKKTKDKSCSSSTYDQFYRYLNIIVVLLLHANNYKDMYLNIITNLWQYKIKYRDSLRKQLIPSYVRSLITNGREWRLVIKIATEIDESLAIYELLKIHTDHL